MSVNEPGNHSEISSYMRLVIQLVAHGSSDDFGEFTRILLGNDPSQQCGCDGETTPLLSALNDHLNL